MTTNLLRRLEDSARVCRALRLLVKQNLGREHLLYQGLGDLARVGTAWRETAWSGLAYQRMAGSVPELISAKSEQVEKVWTELFVRLLYEGLLAESHPGAAVGDFVQPALSLWLLPSRRTPTVGRCSHCRGRIYVRELRFSEETSSVPGRVLVECTACGVRACRLTSGAGVYADSTTLTCVEAGRPGEYARFEFLLSPDEPPMRRTLMLQVRDKTRRTPLPVVRQDMGWARSAQMNVRLPEDSGSDIGSARGVVLAGGGIDFYRCLFTLQRRDGLN